MTLPAHVVIREAVPNDAPSTLKMMQRALTEPRNNYVSTPQEFNYTDAQEREYIRQMQETPNTVMLVAVVEPTQAVIGLVSCSTEGRVARHHVVRLGITVDAQWRGRGIGSALIEGVLLWARHHPQVRRVELEVFTRNVRAVALYLRMGFVVEGHFRQAIYKDGEYLDTYWMAWFKR